MEKASPVPAAQGKRPLNAVSRLLTKAVAKKPYSGASALKYAWAVQTRNGGSYMLKAFIMPVVKIFLALSVFMLIGLAGDSFARDKNPCGASYTSL